jgi:hypothetical protein
VKELNRYVLRLHGKVGDRVAANGFDNPSPTDPTRRRHGTYRHNCSACRAAQRRSPSWPRLLVPCPGRAHDLIHSSESWSPFQFISRFRCIANESSRITSASITEYDRHGQAGHPFNGVNNFLNRDSTAIAEIVNRGLASVQERAERFDVGLRQV